MPIPNSATAGFSAQAEPDALDFDIIQAGMNGTGVLSGCACTPGNSGVNLSVAVASGNVVVAGTVVAVTGATVTPGAASGSNPRFDLVVSNSSGTLSVIAGTAAANPVFPAAAPGTYAVLCAVWIPTSATSITASNISDKRQLVLYNAGASTPSIRTLGSGATAAAAGNHNHSGTYASTAHWATHDVGGSDVATNMPGHTMSAVDGTAAIDFAAQDSGTPSAPNTGDHGVKLFAIWRGWRALPGIRSADNVHPYGIITGGPGGQWHAVANTSTTAPVSNTLGVATATTGTWSTPAATTATGFIQQNTTGTTSGNTASVSSTDARWVRGDNANPWCGYWFHAIVGFPSAAYSSSRILIGMTSNSVATALGADNPTGERHAFKLLNGTGNFLLSIRSGSGTEETADSGIALVQNNVYEFFICARPNGGFCFGEVRNITAGTSSASMIAISGTTPAATTYMRALVGLVTTNTTAKLFNFLRAGCEWMV